MGATGLATTPAEYRDRLLEQPDQQLDAWAAEAMRDISIRRGVLAVLHDVQAASGLDDRGLEKVFTAGGGPPAVVGRDADGRLMVPGGHAPLPGQWLPRDRARRARGAGRVPRRELRGARLRLTAARDAPQDRPAILAARLGGLLRIVHPFPSVLDAAVTAVVALIAGADACSHRAPGCVDAPSPVRDRRRQRLGRRRRRRDRPPREADPGGPGPSPDRGPDRRGRCRGGPRPGGARRPARARRGRRRPRHGARL